MARAREHDWGFWAYAVDGFLIATGFLYWPVLVLGVLLLFVLTRRYSWPADLGLLFGFAPALLVVAISGVADAQIWTAVAVTFAVTSAFAFWWLRCRPAVRQ
jgi:hypothetical protein